MLPTRDKVRVLCHSLKMNPLTGVDPHMMLDLKHRIKRLPSPEKIAELQKDDLESLRVNVDTIIRDLEASKNDRTIGYAIRHEVEKGLPPRRKPLFQSFTDWYSKSQRGE